MKRAPKTIEQRADEALDRCPTCRHLDGRIRSERIAEIVADVKRKNPDALTLAEYEAQVREAAAPLDLPGRAREEFLSTR